jgi:ribosomal protein S6--L-glutamate ligase
MKILILSNSETSRATKSLIEEGKRRGHEILVVHPLQISLKVSDNPKGYDKIYISTKTGLKPMPLSQIDAVIPRLAGNVDAGANILHFLISKGVFSTQSPSAIRVACDKFKTLQACSQAGLKVPLTTTVSSASNIDSLIKKVGVPLVVKTLSGSQGVGVSVHYDVLSAKSTIQTLLKGNTKMILQEYIESRNKDIRAVVVGGKVVAAYQRTAPKGDFRANMSLGGEGASVSLTKEQERFCVQSAQAVGLDVCGVDMLQGKNKETYLVELNSNFGFKIQEVTGIPIALEVYLYIEHAIGRGKTKGISAYNDLMNNSRIRYLFADTYGKNMTYVDSCGKKINRRINSKIDLYKVMLETFKTNK